MKEIKVNITSRSLSRSYNISLDDEFAIFFERELNLITDRNKNLDAKDLLYAFVEKSYENYMQNKEINELFKKLENTN
ncbi:hypothetical protein CBLAS_1339 [Campylobacter blaseri]|uniref:Uncharacterized protein n=1 Tax=Campylobacter blaseri TaxID=2042961 RepID=A0A2P8QZ11_9BACT|nr:hypothetical protein [Campylobacter blaseri]PSM51486.1 hypothetical protein CQ405_07930 [Campylobacter blaseri]PSM52935.1 hypothetical protein CRN67_07935 [Campylobacter blaseri]QKF86506.1 hypothetical protein CBLAS_1339 [Campylobacter blaseri]